MTLGAYMSVGMCTYIEPPLIISTAPSLIDASVACVRMDSLLLQPSHPVPPHCVPLMINSNDSPDVISFERLTWTRKEMAESLVSLV